MPTKLFQKGNKEGTKKGKHSHTKHKESLLNDINALCKHKDAITLQDINKIFFRIFTEPRSVIFAIKDLPDLPNGLLIFLQMLEANETRMQTWNLLAKMIGLFNEKIDTDQKIRIVFESSKPNRDKEPNIFSSDNPSGDKDDMS